MKNYIVILVILLLAMPLYAFRWSGDELNSMEIKEDIKVLSISNTGKESAAVLQDEKGNSFAVNYIQDISPAAVKTILSLKDNFFNWTDLKINKIKFIVTDGNIIEISILPSQYKCKGQDVLPYLPAGLNFTYTDALLYSFRLTKDKIFVKMTGYFINQIDLAEKILDALKNPIAYIKKRDPEYFLAKLDLIQSDLDKLRKENSYLRWSIITLFNEEKIREDIINNVVKIKTENPAYTISQVRDAMDSRYKQSISKDAVNIIFAVYFNEYQD